jgi:hypothetical protein
MPSTGSRNTYPGPIVHSDGRGLVVNGIALHARPPESTLSLHHAKLFGQEGVLPVVQSFRNSTTTTDSDTTSEGALNRTMGEISIATKEQPLVNNGAGWELT